MITIPKRKCNKVNCNELINFNESYCDEHKQLSKQSNKDYDSLRNKRDNQYRKFYNSKAWKDARHISMLRHDSLCQECLRNGLYTQADIVDHITELRDDYSRRLDQKNLSPLCHYHHNKKTYREKQRRLSEQNKNN